MIRILYTDISALDDAAYEMLYTRASPERRARADRCRCREDGLRCLAAEALLRLALGTDRYTVETGPWGKPRIREWPDFHYNLSHSGNFAVIAFGESPVGVDVERLRRDADIRALAARFFAPEEQAYAGEDRDRFFEVWTKKESYLKYLGTGLTGKLTSFSVLSPEPGLRYFHARLPEDHVLSLCTREETWTLTPVHKI